MPSEMITTSPLLLSGIGALIVWRIYARVRRFIGRQPLKVVRAWFSAILFPLLILGLTIGSIAHPLNILAELAGLAIGVGLARHSLHLTRFENTTDGLFYTPNAKIGIAVSLIFVVRIAYRLGQIYLFSAATIEPQTAFIKSPLTLFVFGLLAGYYTWYAVGLLRWSMTTK